MPRDFIINGECLVKVKGGAHMSGFPIGALSELGLSSEQIRITPRFSHYDVKISEFGPDIPAEILCMLSEVNIHMNLVHYNKTVLDVCMAESMGGSSPGLPGFAEAAGILVGAGSPLGNNLPVFSSGCHYISLNLLSAQLSYPWRFRSCYLNSQPLEIPIGTEKSIVSLNFRAIPYVYYYQNSMSGGSMASGAVVINGNLVTKSSGFIGGNSSGTVLWDRTLDT